MSVEPNPSLSGMASFPSIARIAARGSLLATTVSALAFGFSAVSFYETVMKQPILKVYVADTLAYTRDPYGSYEVVAVPITIANSGARDGAVLTLGLDVKNIDTGRTDTFAASYTADAQYFGGVDDVSQRRKRPKAPFSPLSIAGRSAFAGTILFYSVEGRDSREQKAIIEPKAKIEMTLRVVTPEPQGWLDRWLFTKPAPIALKGEVANYLLGALFTGETAKIKFTEPPR